MRHWVSLLLIFSFLFQPVSLASAGRDTVAYQPVSCCPIPSHCAAKTCDCGCQADRAPRHTPEPLNLPVHAPTHWQGYVGDAAPEFLLPVPVEIGPAQTDTRLAVAGLRVRMQALTCAWLT